MNSRLCTGLIKDEPGWNIILNQIGTPFEPVDTTKSLLHRYSVIIINDVPGNTLREKLIEYVNQGGCIIDASTTDITGENKTGKNYLSYLIPSQPLRSFVPYLDIYETGLGLRSHTGFDAIVSKYKLGKGAGYLLGLNVNKLIISTAGRRKYFTAPATNAMPNEFVSRTSKGNVRKLIQYLLIELHAHRNIPFICKPVSPAPDVVPFLFRIDSDYADKKTITGLNKILQKHSVPATWFLHVSAHKNWLETFKKFENQEIAVHGYEHKTSTSYAKNLNNISKALNVLHKHGFEPEGFCAPYGMWSEGLQKALEETDLAYSSEFSLNYDDLPFYISSGSQKKILQIPIHPICIGSLHKAGFSSSEMRSYFEAVIEQKTALNEPVVLYHHPLDKHPEVLEYIFSTVNKKSLPMLTFARYAEWWQKRTDSTLTAVVDENKFQLTTDLDHVEVWKSPDEKAFLKNDNTEIYMQEIMFNKLSKPTIPSETEIKKMHSFDFNLIKLGLLNAWRRERL